MPANYKRLSNKIKEPALVGKTDAECVTILNAKDAVNVVPMPFTITELMACFPTSLPALITLPALTAFRDDAVNQDRPATLNWLQLAYGSGKIPQSEYLAATAIINRTTPGPSWADANWGADLAVAEVATARGF
jgi:hypothetical protein